MKKLSIDQINEALKLAKIVEPQKEKVINELLKMAAEKNEPAPKTKNQFLCILYAPELVGKEYTASVVQIKEGDDANTVLNRISDAAKTQNELAKKKNSLIKTMGEACQFLKRAFIKEKGINIKAKIPVRVLISDNNLL